MAYSLDGVSVIVVPRERFSRTNDALAQLIARTPKIAELIFIDGGSPAHYQKEFAKTLSARAHKTVRRDAYLYPNEARNLGAAQATPSSRYLAFIDNDVLVEPNWLEALLECAEETGADVVGPLYQEGDPAKRIVHMAGGLYREIDTPSGRIAFERHRFAHQPFEKVSSGIRRREVDYVEGHCLLVRRDAFEGVGRFDETILTISEYLDLCLRVRERGGQIFAEPRSIVTYPWADKLTLADIPFFLKRWSVEETRQSCDAIARKRGLRGDCELFAYGIEFVRHHRNRLALFDPNAEWNAGQRSYRDADVIADTPAALSQLLEDMGYSIEAKNQADQVLQAVTGKIAEMGASDSAVLPSAIGAAAHIVHSAGHVLIVTAALLASYSLSARDFNWPAHARLDFDRDNAVLQTIVGQAAGVLRIYDMAAKPVWLEPHLVEAPLVRSIIGCCALQLARVSRGETFLYQSEFPQVLSDAGYEELSRAYALMGRGQRSADAA
jgi:GT2 family glycosyltransferase